MLAGKGTYSATIVLYVLGVTTEIIFPVLFTGHDPARRSGQTVFKVGSGGVRVLTRRHGSDQFFFLKSHGSGRVTLTRYDPIRPGNSGLTRERAWIFPPICIQYNQCVRADSSSHMALQIQQGWCGHAYANHNECEGKTYAQASTPGFFFQGIKKTSWNTT